MSHLEKLDHEHEVSHVNDLWEEAKKSLVMTELKNGLSLQEIVEKNKLDKPLTKPEKIKCCDGRCIHGAKDISFAGSGMLLPEAEFAAMLKSNPDVKIITSHDDCGASKLAFADYEKRGALPAGVTTPAQLAVWWAKDMALKYGLEYQHISANEFNDANHHEAGLWVDETGNFDTNLIAGMPNVFVSQTASCAKDKATRDEISALTNIAFSDHGFGERINEQDPFYIFICAKDEIDKGRLISLAREATSTYGAKVKVEAFVSPF